MGLWEFYRRLSWWNNLNCKQKQSIANQTINIRNKIGSFYMFVNYITPSLCRLKTWIGNKRNIPAFNGVSARVFSYKVKRMLSARQEIQEMYTHYIHLPFIVILQCTYFFLTHAKNLVAQHFISKYFTIHICKCLI